MEYRRIATNGLGSTLNTDLWNEIHKAALVRINMKQSNDYESAVKAVLQLRIDGMSDALKKAKYQSILDNLQDYYKYQQSVSPTTGQSASSGGLLSKLTNAGKSVLNFFSDKQTDASTSDTQPVSYIQTNTAQTQQSTASGKILFYGLIAAGTLGAVYSLLKHK